MIEELKGGPLHAMYLLMTVFRTFQKAPIHRDLGKAATARLPGDRRDLATARYCAGDERRTAARHEVPDNGRGGVLARLAERHWDSQDYRWRVPEIPRRKRAGRRIHKRNLPFRILFQNVGRRIRDACDCRRHPGGYDLPTRRRRVAKTRRSKFLQALKFFKGRKRFEFLRLYWTARVNYPSREEALF